MIHTTPHYASSGRLRAIDIYIETESIDAFKLLVQRALNCWDEAPPECKELGDYLSHGKVLQDYRRSSFDNNGTKAVEEGPIDKFPNLSSQQLPICSECGGRGFHHHHLCSTLQKK